MNQWMKERASEWMKERDELVNQSINNRREREAERLCFTILERSTFFRTPGVGIFSSKAPTTAVQKWIISFILHKK